MRSQFTRYPEPRDITPDEFASQPRTTLFAAGILNPFGPTMVLLVASGDVSGDASVPLVQITLNPFMQEMLLVGEALFGDTCDPATDYAPFLPLGLRSCPTLLLPGTSMEFAQAAQLFARFVAPFDDGQNAYQEIKQYLGRPGDRIASHAEPIAQALKAISKDPASPVPTFPPAGAMSPQEALEFAQL